MKETEKNRLRDRQTSITFHAGLTLNLSTFAKNLGYETALNRDFKEKMLDLIRNDNIKLQQGGYVAHNMAHPMNVVILKDFQVDPYRRKVEYAPELSCPKCRSIKVQRKGTGLSFETLKLQCYFCDDCGYSFYIPRY